MHISDELIRNIRHSVWEWLGVLSDLEAQRRYERDVPIAYHSAELFIGWRDAFIADSPATRRAFSDEQFDALQRFSVILRQVEDEIAPLRPTEGRRPYPSLADLHRHHAWSRAVTAAQETLPVLTPCTCQLCKRRADARGAV